MGDFVQKICRTLIVPVAGVIAVVMLSTAQARAQNYTFNALYEFSGASGNGPRGALISDSSGNLYGTTEVGGAASEGGAGVVFELVNNSGTYTEQVLYSFTGGSDGAYPVAGLAIDTSGNLYGAASGGGAYGYGTLFELANNGNGSYTFKLLYTFSGQNDGFSPLGAILDSDDDVYGTTEAGGANSDGTVFELVNSDGNYVFRTLYTFTGGNDGAYPQGGIALDAKDNVYGTADSGGANGYGTVFELVNNGGSFSEETLYTFTGGDDGAYPEAGVTFDAQGNLYGTTEGIYSTSAGSVYELANSSGAYTEKTLYDFTGVNGDGANPQSAVILDANGDVFGTTTGGGVGTSNYGTVYELVYSSSAETYSEQILYSFTDQTDGYKPKAGLLMNSSGDLFGASASGGSSNDGVVWELISPIPPATTSLALTASPSSVYQGESITLAATITPTPTGTAIAGTVSFSEGSTVLGTASVSNNAAVLTVPAALLSVGDDTISAQLTPSSSNVQGSTASVMETVNPASDVADLSGNNTFTGNQTVNGAVTATSFAGNGSGLTNVVAAGLVCAGCVGNAQLGVDYAGSASQGGPASNSLLLGGLAPSAYAIQDSSNSFNGDQSINGNLLATGNLNGANGNFTGSVTSAGVNVSPSGTANASQAYNSNAVDTAASLFNSGTDAAQNVLFQWQAEPVAGTNDTANPAATLSLLYGANGTPAETGLSVNANGTINFATGQTFPGLGAGSITGVTAGTGLTGGGTSGNVTLEIANAGVTNAMLANPSFTLTPGTGLTGGGTVALGGTAAIGLAANACPAGSAVTSLPFGCSPFASAGANTFTGNQTVNGTVTATAFVGNGAGLTNINVATATTAATAANALALGGQPPSYYATAAGNTFSGTQTMPSVNVTGATHTGTLTIGGGTAITEYVSVTDSVTLPALGPGACASFQTAPLTGFTPGVADTFALGIPHSLLVTQGPYNKPGNGPWLSQFPGAQAQVFLTYQVWETTANESTTITIEVCNPSAQYVGGDSGTIRVDVFKH